MSEPNYHAIKKTYWEFTGNLNEKNKSNNERSTLFRSIDFGNRQDNCVWAMLRLQKTKNGDSLKKESFVVHVKSEDFRDKTGYTYEVERTLPIGKNKNVIRLIKEEIGGKK